LDLERAVFLFFAGMLGGALNAVAGGGSFISFPALVFTGVPEISANATNTVALWTGVTASSRAYRSRLQVSRRMLIPLVLAGFIGGVLGAFLLLNTPERTFRFVLPWLMLGSTLLFVFSKRLAGGRTAVTSRRASNAGIAIASFLELVIAVYGGYFGGGVGIVNLALLGAAGMADIHEMNALKTVLGSAINGVAVLVFVIKGAVYWPQAVVMIVGAVVGGYFGARYALKLRQRWVRDFVIAVGISMTAYFFLRAYRAF
jgi:uncharacterized membrane protein YfcA